MSDRPDGVRVQPIQRRGFSTRNALLDALEASLDHTPWRELSVREIVEGTGRSTALFWRYWATIEAAVRELIIVREQQERELLPGAAMVAEFLSRQDAFFAAAGDGSKPS